jgi:hypothetical protein
LFGIALSGGSGVCGGSVDGAIALDAAAADMRTLGVLQLAEDADEGGGRDGDDGDEVHRATAPAIIVSGVG